jgi:hypothetical protein
MPLNLQTVAQGFSELRAPLKSYRNHYCSLIWLTGMRDRKYVGTFHLVAILEEFHRNQSIHSNLIFSQARVGSRHHFAISHTNEGIRA